MRTVLLTTCLMFGSLVGCKTEQADLYPELNPYVSEGRVQFESCTTQDSVHVVKVDTTRETGGLLKVYLTLRNLSRDQLWADIRTTFLDEAGHVLEQTNWEPTLLDRKTVSEYTCTSLSAKAADYQIVIRKPKKPSTNMR